MVPVAADVPNRSDPPAPAPAEPSILAADHLSKWYGQVIGLNDVTVSVPPGITGLLGPNGAGKSTFMKLITGQLKPSKGTVKVLGEPIWGNPRLYHRIGFCPEQDAFYDRMTGLDWVTALVRLNGLDEKAARDAAVRAMTTVVADTGDIEAVRRLKPVDCTTNPTIVLKALGTPMFADAVAEALRWGRAQGGFRSSMTGESFIALVKKHGLRFIRQFDSWGAAGEFDVRLHGDVITVFCS